MANLLLTTRHVKRVGKQWTYRFIRRHPELKMRFSRAYDFQRALCEDPDLIGAWFRLVANMRAKYAIQDSDFYNFDETGFMMGVICGNMVVTHADRRGRGKQLQPGNWEWVTVIECVSSRLSIHTPYPYGNFPYGYGIWNPYGHVWPYGNNFGLRPQYHVAI